MSSLPINIGRHRVALSGRPRRPLPPLVGRPSRQLHAARCQRVGGLVQADLHRARAGRTAAGRPVDRYPQLCTALWRDLGRQVRAAAARDAWHSISTRAAIPRPWSASSEAAAGAPGSTSSTRIAACRRAINSAHDGRAPEPRAGRGEIPGKPGNTGLYGVDLEGLLRIFRAPSAGLPGPPCSFMPLGILGQNLEIPLGVVGRLGSVGFSQVPS